MKCSICKKRDMKLTFAESFLEFTHGYGKPVCRECYIRILENKVKEINKGLKEQKKLLKNETK